MVEELYKADCEVYVCAPDRERSAQSHARTIKDPITVRQANIPHAASAVQVTGTPADCTALALQAWSTIFPQSSCGAPRLVVSGINRGRNVGLDCVYSGTVAGAREAAMSPQKVAAIAVSLCDFAPQGMEDYRRAAQYVTPLVEVILGEGSGHKLPPGCVLNVNVPPARVPVKGYFITHQGNSFIVPKVVRYDPKRAPSRAAAPQGSAWGTVGLSSLALNVPTLAYLWFSAGSATLHPSGRGAGSACLAAAGAVALAVGMKLAFKQWAASPSAQATYLFGIKTITEDQTAGADSNEVAKGWVSITPLGNISYSEDGGVLFTTNLPHTPHTSDSDKAKLSPWWEAAALIQHAGKEADLLVQCTHPGLLTKL